MMHAGQHLARLLSCRDKIRGLFGPFLAAAPEAAASPCPAGVTVSISVQPAGPGSGCAAACEGTATSDAAAAQQSAILAVYQQPDRHAGLYNYAKALESVESALLGGFYYKHFLLAKNVIGTSAKGKQAQRKASSPDARQGGAGHGTTYARSCTIARTIISTGGTRLLCGSGVRLG